MAAFKTLDRIGDVRGKRVLVRVDLNVPVADGKVTDATRIERIAPTILELADKGAKVIMLAHFGRPKGGPEPEFSLAPIAEATAGIFGRPVAFADDCIGPAAAQAIEKLPDGGILLLENTRFHKGEEKNDPAFAEQLAERRYLRQRRVFRRASRACLDRRAGPSPPGLRRQDHAGRARRAGKGARQSGAPGGGDRRRRQGLDQDRSAHEPRQEGRHAGDRRRHGQYFPCRARHRCRQITVRARPRRYRQADHDRSGVIELRAGAAGRRRRRPRVQGGRGQRNGRHRRGACRCDDPRPRPARRSTPSHVPSIAPRRWYGTARSAPSRSSRSIARPSPRQSMRQSARRRAG